MKILIVKALTKPNTYFLFRENGEEVEVIIKNNEVIAYPALTKKENKYITKNYLRNEHSDTEQE